MILTRLAATLAAALHALLWHCPQALAQEAEQATPSDAQTPAIIATRHAPPFAIKTDDGWEGITIELVRRIVEAEGLEIVFREMSLEGMLEATARGEVTAAAAALTMTPEREESVDFTHPFYTSGLGIVAPLRSEVTWYSGLLRFFSAGFLQSAGALLALLSLVGLVIWLVERRRNEQFPAGAVEGVGSGIWWSAVTMTTVGYGDKAPVTLLGRIVGLVWMFASIIMISGVTAAIATSLTVGQLQQSVVGLEDLYDKRVLTLADSTGAAFLADKLVRHGTVTDIRDALARLESGDADVVVHDLPILRHLVGEHHADSLRVLPNRLARQDYAIALPPGHPRREQINRLILETIQSPEWEILVGRYLGARR